MRILEPSTLTILPTSRCPAHCRHCSVFSGPERKETLSYAQLEMILKQALEELELIVVVFSGGEPTLLGDDLLKAIELCKKYDVITRVVTNAFWAKDMAAARKKVHALREAGLDELNISTDDYHQPFVGLDRVHNAFEAACDLGFMAIVLANACGPKSELTAEKIAADFGGGEMEMRFDAEGRTIRHERKEGETQIILSNGELQRLGRSVDEMAEDELAPERDLYEIAKIFGGCVWAVRAAAVSPKGHLVSCCGFELEDNPILDFGDLNETPLTELLNRADADLITNMIAILGPPRIRQLLEELVPGETVWPKASYRSYCEICQDLVGIPQNRQVLYKHQGAFIDPVMKVREACVETYGSPDGRVRIPAGMNLGIETTVERRGAIPVAEQRSHVADSPPA